MIIIGTGAQAKYAVDIALLKGIEIEKIYEPYAINWKNDLFLNKYKVEKFDIKKIQRYSMISMCFYDSFLKESWVTKLQNLSCLFITLIHPSVIIGLGCHIGQGTIINAGAIIQPEAIIGNFCMIHSKVSIDHDCKIRDYVNLAPGVTLAGGVDIGEHTVINTGTIVGPNVSIGESCIIGAGSLVLKSIPDNKVAFGHPIDVKNMKGGFSI